MACRGLVLKLYRQHDGDQNPQLPIRPRDEILPAKTSEASSFYVTGSLRIGYSKLENRVKNIPRTFNIIGKLETRALSTKKPQRKTWITGSINRVARRKRARNVTLSIKMMRG